MNKTFPTRLLPWLLMLVVAGPVAWAQDNAGCAAVDVRALQDLVIGRLRAGPQASGFIEVDPTRGLAVTGHGFTHEGRFAPAQVLVSGPPGAEVEFELFAVRPGSDGGRLRLAELIIHTVEGPLRLPQRGGPLTVRLPLTASAEQRAVQRLNIGASIAVRAGVLREAQLSRPLRLVCRSVRGIGVPPRAPRGIAREDRRTVLP